MARPRVIKLEDGEVSLQGFSTERANQLSALIKGELPQVVIPSGVDVQAVASLPVEVKVEPTALPVDLDNLPETCYGVHLNPETKIYELVTVAYNSATKQATVKEVKLVDKNKGIAVGEMKLAFYKKGII